MTKKLGLILAVLILAILGFAFLYQPKTPPPGPAPKAPTPGAKVPSAPRDVAVTLAEQNTSGESGTALISGVGEKVTVALTLAGAPADLAQPAHIHLGSCEELGAVKYPLSAPLNGSSTTALGMSLSELLAELPLAVNVHKSAAEAGTYVSCGDIAAP